MVLITDEHKPICVRCQRDDFSCEYQASEFIRVATADPAHTLSPRASISHDARKPPQHLSVVNDDLFLAYLRSTLFVVSMADNKSENPSARTWPGFLAHPREHPLASQCLLALSQVYFGSQRDVPDVSARGRVLYVQSLSRLNTTLSDTHLRQTDDTLLSIMIFFLYEMLVLSTSAAWIEHALGLGRLIELRGPDSFNRPDQRTLFEVNRFIIILASLAIAKPTFLSRPEWKTVPWIYAPDRKNSMQSLLDIFADVATLKGLLVSDSYQGLRHVVHDGIYEAIGNLRSWRSAWDMDNVLDVTDVPNTYDDQNILPSVLHFSSVYLANAFSLYNAILIQALRLLSSANNGRLDAVHATEMVNAAAEICKATEYQLQVSDPMAGQFMMLFPLRMASLALEDSVDPLKTWVAAKLRNFTALRSGWAVAREMSMYGGRASRTAT